MNALTTNFQFSNAVPAFLREQAAASVHADLSANLPLGGWPKISYRGSRWRLITPDGGERVVETTWLDVIIVQANPNMSKRLYRGDYNPNQEPTAPDCWADNGRGPGARVPDPVSHTCATCEMNKWGSEVSKSSGKAVKACSDVKRLSVLVFPAGGEPNAELFPTPYALDVPAASLKGLEGFARTLTANGASAAIVVTRLSFVPEAAFPQLVFTPRRWLDEREAALSTAVRGSDTVMLELGLNEVGDTPQQIAAPAHSAAGQSQTAQQVAQAHPAQEQQAAAQPTSAPTKPRTPRAARVPGEVVQTGAAPTQTAGFMQQGSTPQGTQQGGMFGGVPQTGVEPTQAASVLSQGAVQQNPETSAAVDRLLDGLFPA